LQPADRLVGSSSVERFLGGFHKRMGKGIVAARQEHEQVRRDRLAGGAAALKQLSGPAVGGLSFGGRDRVIDGAADQRVDERERVLAGEHVDPTESVCDFARLSLRQRRELRRARQPRPVPEHGHGPGQTWCVIADASGAPQNPVAERRDRDRQTRQIRRPLESIQEVERRPGLVGAERHDQADREVIEATREVVERP
jgi:hypothetical protein